jgi:hypothetical protein
MNKKYNMLILFGVVLALLVFVTSEVRALDPCCTVTGIDNRTGMVTANNTATGQTFQFQLNKAATLKTMKIGQGVYADFGTKQVSVDGATPCCSVLNLSVPLKGSFKP